MFENIYIQQRLQKANNLRANNLNPYRNDCSINLSNANFLQQYEYLKSKESNEKNRRIAKYG